MENISSPATMDRPNKLKTVLVLAIFFGVCFLLAYQGNIYTGALAALLTVAICTVVRGHLPDRYVLEENGLLIDAPFKKIRIPFKQIVGVRWMEPSDVKGLYRKWGSSGLFGDWGYFSSAKIPTLKVYTRRSDHWMLITTYERGRYVIAPDDPDFFYYLNRAVKGR